MVRRLVSLFVCLLVLAGMPAEPVFAEDPLTAETPAVVITEIYPNAPGSPEAGEFVELFNPGSAAVLLDGYVLSRKNTTFTQPLDGLTVEAGGYLAVMPGFALVNSGGTLVLAASPDAITGMVTVQEITYPELDEAASWSLIDDAWQDAPPSAGLVNPVPAVPEEPIETDEQEPVCQADTIIISEILANPAGADSEGGEFIEFHNTTTAPVTLNGCLLTTDKVSEYALPDFTIEPGGYFAIGLADKLLNGGGQVTFIGETTEETVEYPALGDDEAWAVIDGAWQLTELSTAGAINLPTPPEPEPAEKTEPLAPCPAGKFRNPATNRCKSITLAASSLLPCQPGQIRNPLTNRCRRVSSASSSLTPCRSGYARNPETNRCRKVAAAVTEVTPCKPGYERNPETNRCRKVSAPLSSAAAFPTSGPAPLHGGILVSVSFLALLYGLYEYRLDLANWYVRLRERYGKTA